MGLPGIFVGLLAMVLFGDAIVRWIRPQLAGSIAGRAGLAFLLGPTAIAFGCFAANLAGVPFGPRLSWIATGLSFAAWAAAVWIPTLRRRGRSGPAVVHDATAQNAPTRATATTKTSTSSLRDAAIPFWALLLLPIAIGVALAATLPPVKDALVNWSLKTRILWTDGTMFTPDFQAEHRYLFHTNYPPLVPVVQVYLYGLAGDALDRPAKLAFCLFHLGAPLLLLGFLQRRHRGLAPMAIAAIAAAIPHFYRTDGLYRFGGSVASGYAEPAFAALAGACVAATLEWMETRCARDAWLAGTLLGACLFTKQEGLALGLSVGAGLAVALIRPKGTRPRLSSLLAAGASCALIAVPWFLYRGTLPAKDENYLHRLTDLDIVAAGLWRIPTILVCSLEEALSLRHHGLVWPLLLVALCLAGRKVLRPGPSLALVTIATMATLYFAVFVVTPLPVVDLLYTSIPRTFFQLDVIALVLVGVLLPADKDRIPHEDHRPSPDRASSG